MSQTCESPFKQTVRQLLAANQYIALIETLDALLPVLLDVGSRILRVESAHFFAFLPDEDSFISTAHHDAGEKTTDATSLVGEYRLSRNQGAVGAAASSGKPLVMKDVDKGDEAHHQHLANAGLKITNNISTPLFHQEQLLGVIQLINPVDRTMFDEEDIELSEIYGEIAAAAIARTRFFRKRLMNQELVSELKMTAKIQKHCFSQLPDDIPGAKLWGKSVPAQVVGGDICDCIQVRDSSYLMFVADVSGHGLAAGFIMSAIWSSIRSEVNDEPRVDKLLERVNALMFHFLSGESFFTTIIMMRYWPETDTLDLVSGGHAEPFWFNGNDFKELKLPKGLPLGTIEDAEYECVTIDLESQDTIIVYSDGLNEAFNEHDEMFGEQRIMDVIRQATGFGHGKRLMDAAIAWTGARANSDDITILELRRVD